MFFRTLALVTTMTVTATVTRAQTQDLSRETNIQRANGEITTLGAYCDETANSDAELCIQLATGGGPPVTNFVPIAGAAGLAALVLGLTGGGGGGGTPTTTPSTTD